MTLPGLPTFEEMFTTLVKRAFHGEHGPMLAKVENYNQATQRATARPLVWIYNGDDLVQMDILHDVPIQWPGGGGCSLTFPLGAGDVVILIPMATDVSAWSASGTVDDGAPTKRRFSLSDVIGIPKVTSKAGPLSALAYAPEVVVLHGSEIRLGDSTATDFVALASLVMNALNAIIAVQTAQQTAFDSHVHDETQSAASGNYSGAPASSFPPGAIISGVAATKVKAK